MAVPRNLAKLLLFCLISCYVSVTSSASSYEFLRCLSESIPNQLLYTQSSSGFTSVLKSSIRNPKFFTNSTVKPFCIVTPTDAFHVQAAVRCGRLHGVRLRVRSGGHDYEGLSYRSERPEVFAVVDLAELRTVSIDTRARTAWVQSGATLGELYYAIGKASSGLAFPAGVCPTIGVGGHLSGGGIGLMMRKYGIAADNILDAILVNANGALLDKTSMGKDVFWAIRGGGGESFGIVLSWKVKLVPVPPKVTVFNIQKTVAEGAIDMVTKWQDIAPALPDELVIRVVVQGQQALFQSLYLGTCVQLLPVMSSLFPDLGMNRTHCKEMTWLQSAAFINFGDAATPVEALLNRTTSLSTFTKNKSDYVRQAIAKAAWEKIYSWFTKPGAGIMILEPQGGTVGRIPDKATPYAHRSGVLYNIQHITFWTGGGGAAATGWMRDFYMFMEAFVSKNPRAAYVNYRDLDIGENVVVGDVTSYESGKVWGEKYFACNYRRLAIAKGMVDPDDYFRNEQSIPPLVARK